ncbi:MAG TPA: 3-phosphoglycerate dehydrogenase [Vicinamibacterales bacterium]|nr:3-phosphoglycerate dehydrogenase [Vicinamibacterales bacterium]
MTVLIADKFEQSGIDGLKALGCDVTYEPDLQEQTLAGAVSSKAPDVLVVRSTKVNEAAMGPSLKLIVRAGAGVNTIDVKAATARKIQVANCPGKNSIAVAELAFGLLLALDRRIPDNVADLRAGKWNKKEYSKARGLYGATLGVLGTGPIAREMMKRAAAFGMPLVAWSRRFDGQDRPMSAGEAKELGLEAAASLVPIRLAPSPADVAARADVLSIHLALAPETRHLVNAAVLGRLKPGSFVINTARGEVVDHDALRAAMRERKLRVALDVFAAEPAAAAGDFADPIVQEPGVYGTHHIGASTDQAQEAIAAETVRIVKAYRDTGRAPNAVNA